MSVTLVDNNLASATAPNANDDSNYFSYYDFYNLVQQMQLKGLQNETKISEVLNNIQAMLGYATKSEYSAATMFAGEISAATKVINTFSWIIGALVVASIVLTMGAGAAVAGAAAAIGIAATATGGLAAVLTIAKSITTIGWITPAEQKLAEVRSYISKDSNIVDFAGSENDDLASSRNSSMRQLSNEQGQINDAMSYQQQVLQQVGMAGRNAKK